MIVPIAYYVALDTADIADRLWASYGTTTPQGSILGNNRPQQAQEPAKAPANESTEALDC
jgi:hypothetical protein